LPRALVLGGYGLIGLACCHALRNAGFEVRAVGRSRKAIVQANGGFEWVMADLVNLTAQGWGRLLIGVDVVVNAAGALQDGARDDVRAIHEGLAASLIAALGGSSTRLIQISAAGVSPEASTEFFRSKARADAAIMASPLDWIILRPTLVISPQAYGGTALLRAAAAMPLVSAEVYPEVPVQTVGIDDLTQAVVRAATGGIPAKSVADLTESDARSLGETVRMLREWLGYPSARWRFAVPEPVLWCVRQGADALGWLGWRSPLRSTALLTLKNGITGSAQSWEALGGPPCQSLSQTLNNMPATLQERWFARLYLLMPLAVATLALFWMISGLVAVMRFETARAVLEVHGVTTGMATLIVGAGSIVDILLGLAVLWRPWAQRACLAMIGVALGYLGGSLWIAPDLWADPMGPMIKVVPSVTLALLTAALLEER
jgi:uncharacterized protein YbjT (DUF2867 family)